MAWSPPSNVAPNDILTSTLWNQSVVDNTKSLVVSSLNAQTGTTYTLVLDDSYNKVVTLDNASPITLTIPTNASVAFQTGAVISILQLGAGQVTVQGAGGVTLRSADSRYKTAYQYSFASLIKIATDQWVMVGSLSQ